MRKLYILLLLALLLLVALTNLNNADLPRYTKAFSAIKSVPSDNETVLQSEQNVKKIYLLLIHSYDFQHFQELASLLDQDSLNHLSLAGMSVRTYSGIGSYHNLFSLYTGAHLQGLKDWSAYMVDDELQGTMAGELYTQWTGQKIEAQIIHPFLMQWQKLNQGAQSGLPYGWLSEQLQKQGTTLQAFGNSDTLTTIKRWGPLFISNAEGEAAGIIDQRALVEQESFPGGFETNWSLFNDAVQADLMLPQQSMLVFEIGDFERIYQHQQYIAETRLAHLQQQVTQNLTRFLEDILHEARATEQADVELWLIASSLSPEAMQQERHLAPFVKWTPTQPGGVLVSASTRQPGIVSNLDVMPSLLQAFGLEIPAELPGNVIKVQEPLGQQEKQVKQEDIQLASLQPWLSHYDYLFTIYKERRPILTKYISWVIALLIAIMIYFWLQMRYMLPGKVAVRVALAALLLSPLLFLYLTPIIKVLSHNQWLMLLAFSALSLSALLEVVLKESQTVMAWVAGLTVGALVCDLLLGAPLMQRSFIGYDPLIGARYYGIGNEYAGVLIGGTILFLTARRQFQHGQPNQYVHRKLYPILFSLLLFFIWFVIAAPGLGANFGASLAAAAGFFMVILALFRVRLSFKRMLLVSSLGFVLLLAVFLFLHATDSQTHIGRALTQLSNGTEGFQYLSELAKRKWEMNLKLIKRSLWGKLFFTLLIVLVVLFLKRRELNSLNQAQQNWYTGLRISTFSAFFLLAVNDSGIVSAATALLFTALPLLYMSFQKETQQSSKEEAKIERLGS